MTSQTNTAARLERRPSYQYRRSSTAMSYAVALPKANGSVCGDHRPAVQSRDVRKSAPLARP